MILCGSLSCGFCVVVFWFFVFIPRAMSQDACQLQILGNLARYSQEFLQHVTIRVVQATTWFCNSASYFSLCDWGNELLHLVRILSGNFASGAFTNPLTFDVRTYPLRNLFGGARRTGSVRERVQQSQKNTFTGCHLAESQISSSRQDNRLFRAAAPKMSEVLSNRSGPLERGLRNGVAKKGVFFGNVNVSDTEKREVVDLLTEI